MDETRDIRQRTLSGLGWTAVSAVGQQLLQFAFTAALARILVPRDFGLIAMIAVFTGLAYLFVDLGLGPAIVQRQEVEERHLSSALWANFVVGLAATAVLMGLAPLIASFYGEPRLLALTLASAPALAVASLAAVQTSLLERQLEFKKLAAIETGSLVIGNAVGVAMAVTGYGVWSFVALGLVRTATRTAMLWVSTSWRPRTRPDRRSVGELWNFSSRLTGVNLLNYWSNNADNLLVGRFVGTTALALYARAYNLMLIPAMLVSSVTSRVMFSALSRLQDDVEHVKRVYLRALGLIGLISFPLCVGMFVLAKPFILTVYGSNWRGAVVILEILCVPAVFRCLFQATGWIFMSQGRTDVMFRWGIIWSVGVIVAFVIGLAWGVRGVATAFAVCNVLITLPILRVSGRLVGASVVEVARAFSAVAAASVFMGVAIRAVVWALPAGWSSGTQLGLGVLTGIVSYTLVLQATSPEPYVEFKRLVGDYRRPRL